MDKKLIQEIIDIIDKNDINEIEVGVDKVKISVKKHPDSVSFAGSVAVEQAKAPASVAEKQVPEFQNCFAVSSPLAGVFYASPSPGTASFADVGDKIEAGQTLCIVEAMKLMNEISSDRSGVIKAIEVKNEETVAKDQVLFYIEPC